MARVTKKDVVAQVTTAIGDGSFDIVKERLTGVTALREIALSMIGRSYGNLKADFARTEFARRGVVVEFPEHSDLVYFTGMGGVSLDGDGVRVVAKFTVVVEKVELKPQMQWVDIDAETRKLLPVLDENRQPVMKKSDTVRETVDDVRGYFIIPIAFLVDLMNEIDRPSLLENVHSSYVPARLGDALASLLPGMSIPKQMLMPSMSMRRVQSMLHPLDEMAMMHCMDAYARPPVPCRLFLQPHADGRTEIVAEPYSKEELRKNDDEIRNRSDWARWEIERSETFQKIEVKRREEQARLMGAKA